MKPVFHAGNNASDSWNVFIVVGVVCTLLVVLLMAALYLLRVKQKKGGWNPCLFPKLCPWIVLLREGGSSDLY